METANMEASYQKAATLLNQMIPENWSKVYLYAAIDEESQQVLFYYDPISGNAPVYCLDIPKLFPVNDREFRGLLYELNDCFDDLWQEFKRNDQEPWTNLTFILENTGKFKIDYSYADISEFGDYEKLIIWRYETLGIRKGDENTEKVLKKHLESKES